MVCITSSFPECFLLLISLWHFVIHSQSLMGLPFGFLTQNNALYAIPVTIEQNFYDGYDDVDWSSLLESITYSSVDNE